MSTPLVDKAAQPELARRRWLETFCDRAEQCLYAVVSLLAVYIVAGGGFTPMVQRTVPVALMFAVAFVAAIRPRRPAGGSAVLLTDEGEVTVPELERASSGTPSLWQRVKRIADPYIRALTAVAALAGIVATLYLPIFQDDLVRRPGLPTTVDTVISVAGIICLLVVTWTRMGAGLALFGVAGLVYVLYGDLLPDPFGHVGFTMERAANYIWTSTEGVFGSLLGVITRTVMIFIVLGALMEVSGAGQFFINFAAGVGRRLRSGPAQAAIISSGLMGTINGSAVANVASTGPLTIPLMKRMGYTPVFAGAVESSSGIVGQILPPVMGSAAFLMSQTTGIPYVNIATAAAIPAVLFLASIGIAAHLQTLKSGIGASAEERQSMPTVRHALRTGGVFLIPLVVLVWFLYGGRSPSYAGMAAMVVLLVIVAIRGRGRNLHRTVWEMLVRGGRNSVQILLAIATVGVILGALQVSGLGNRMSELIIQLAGGSLVVTLVITMIASLILGIGLPTSATYLLLAVMVAPAMVELGVGLLEAHLFILYFGCLSDLTPPVAVSPYVAAGIAGGSPVATSWRAFFLTLPGFLLPFGFALDAALIGQGNAVEIIIATVFAICGTLLVAAGGIGFLIGDSQWWERILMIVGGAGLIIPNAYGRVGGIVLLALALTRPVIGRIVDGRRSRHAT